MSNRINRLVLFSLSDGHVCVHQCNKQLSYSTFSFFQLCVHMSARTCRKFLFDLYHGGVRCEQQRGRTGVNGARRSISGKEEEKTKASSVGKGNIPSSAFSPRQLYRRGQDIS